MPGDSNYLSQHFRQTASLGLLEAKGTSRLAVEVQAISSTLRSVYAWEEDVCYPLVHGIWNLATLWLRKAVGNRCIQLRYTGVQAQCSHMLFPQPLPATNIRMLAATPTVRQHAGGFCPVLSSHREACLEASCQLAAFLWQREGSSILSQEVPRLALYCTWRYPPGLHCYPASLKPLANVSAEDLRNSLCRQCGTVRD